MDSEGVYPGLSFGEAPIERPLVFINMVATIDGKIVTGGRDEPVMDLGSAVDHASMRQIENAAQAVLIGAGNLRSTPKLWYPQHLLRFVLTSSGNVPRQSRFFTDAPEKAFVLMDESNGDMEIPGVNKLTFGRDEFDFVKFLRYLRKNLGIQRLLVEGGSELNSELLQLGLVDELFLTVAPKIKLGRSVPTYAGGKELPREAVQAYELVSCLTRDNEVFLRYRR